MTSAPLLEARGLCVETPEGRVLVRDLDLVLGHERVALIGRNGVGKSTLLDVLAGREPPARGELVQRGTCLLVSQDATREGAGHARAPQSPGEHQRARLEAVRGAASDLLLLDEPTRDLDPEGVRWLLDWFARWRGGLLVVSHDRRVLQTFSQFVVMTEAGCYLVRGAFGELQDELARREEIAQRRYVGELNRLVAKEKHNEALRQRRQRKKNVGRIREIDRCPARILLNDKRSYKQESQGKRRVLQEMRIATARAEAKAARRALRTTFPLELELPTPAGIGTPVLRCEGLTADLGGRRLFADVSLALRRERIALCGPSGAGKTTLVEMALGLRRPTSGHATCDEARLGYIAQNAENWRREESLVALLARQRSVSSPEQMAGLLRAHCFPLALADRPLETLSPGERLRAALICLAHRQPRVELLVLDEPTQHLDFEGLAALEAVLGAWRGGLLVVSHDSALLAAAAIETRLEL